MAIKCLRIKYGFDYCRWQKNIVSSFNMIWLSSLGVSLWAYNKLLLSRPIEQQAKSTKPIYFHINGQTTLKLHPKMWPYLPYPYFSQNLHSSLWENKMMSSMALSSASLCSSFISQHPKLSITASPPSFHTQTTKPISLKRSIVALAAPETLTAEPVTGIESSDNTPQQTTKVTTTTRHSSSCVSKPLNLGCCVCLRWWNQMRSQEWFSSLCGWRRT